MSNRETIALIVLLVAVVVAPRVIGFFATKGSRRALALMGAMSAVVSVGIALLGSAWLIGGQLPNIWLAMGVVVFSYSWAFSNIYKVLRHPIGPQRLLWSLRVRSIGNMLAGLLCAVGSFIYGGAIGVLGSVGASVWFLLAVPPRRASRTPDTSIRGGAY